MDPQTLLKSENLPLILAFSAWTLAWKGVALWHAARRGEKPWFVALLIVNTVGLLEIAYLAFVVRRAPKPPAAPGTPA